MKIDNLLNQLIYLIKWNNIKKVFYPQIEF